VQQSKRCAAGQAGTDLLQGDAKGVADEVQLDGNGAGLAAGSHCFPRTTASTSSSTGNHSG
jgi:hypothetical protein